MIKVIDHKEEVAPWAERHFAEAELSDVRRVDRVRMIAEAMAADPGKSLPQLFVRPYDVKAAYQLFKQEEATPDNLQAGHREWVLAEMTQTGTYLLIEDTTSLSFCSRQPIVGLGPVGNSKDGQDGRQGFHLHSVLSVRWPAEATPSGDGERPAVQVLGLCDQQYYIRRPRPAGETIIQRLKRARESQLWEQASYRMGPVPDRPAVRWVSVADRGADIYEYIISKPALGHGYVVRAAKSRALMDPVTGQAAGHLFETARGVKALGQFDLALRARPGRSAYTATLSVSATPVCLRSPQRPGYSTGRLPPMHSTVVRVWEKHPPPRMKALEWILLTDAPVETFVQALEVALQYSARWIIEEFHKALKTGLGAERWQLETAEGLFAATAIQSVVALRLINLRERVRIHPEAPAEEAGLDELELQVLRAHMPRPIHTVYDVALALGRLGGHLNRKADGMPGWQTLSRGMCKLRLLIQGVRLAFKMKKFG